MEVDVNELMGEMGWVRQLARSLLRDGDAANDVAQEAFLVANQHPPEEGRPLRPWLYRVVLNLIRMRGRGASRRSARELAVGGDLQSVPTSDELVERIETQRVLAAEVIALAEPYRSTILLHYVEGFSSAEIARRLGVPSATVRRRLKHALDELRDRLQTRDDGPKQGWLAALVPLARTNSHVAMGAVAMKKVLAIVVMVVVALLIGGGGWSLWRRLHGKDGADVAAMTGGGTTLHVVPPGSSKSARAVELPAWLAQAGVAGRHVAGRVVASDQVVANATVRIGVLLGDPRRHAEAMRGAQPYAQIAVVQTTQTGEFDFGLLPAANIVVSAEADGKSPVSISVGLADPKSTPDHLVLQLGECRSRMFGIVRDSAGPIAFARIKVAGLGGVTADAKGRYSLCWAATNFANFRVEADGYGSIYADINAFLYGELARDFTLVPEATIDGTVVDEAGKPIAAATVDARNLLADGRHEVATGTTVADESGHFQLSGLAPAKYSLTAIADHFATDTHVVVVAVAGAASHGVKLVVQRRARITGRVMMQGTPVVGAQVTVARHVFSGRGESSADTQADGSFVLDGVQFGTTELHVAPYDVRAPQSIKIESNAVEVTIEVSPRASLFGQVTRHHVPMTDTSLSFSRYQQASAWTDDAGNYHLDDLPAGTGLVQASNSHAWTSKSVTLAAGEAQHLDLELDGGGAVRGTVVDEHGAVVPGVYIHLNATIGDDACESMTDANGMFVCETLAGHADYVPHVYPSFALQQPFQPAQGDAFPAIHVEDGDAAVTGVRLAIKHDLRAIRGTVVDDTGAPVADVHVVVDVSQPSNAPPMSARTDGDGAFTIDNLAPGGFDLRAHASDGSEGKVAAVASGTSGVRIKLVRGGRVEGTLVGFTAPPFVFAETPTLGGDMQDAIVSGDHFTFTGMPVGHYSISALVNGTQIDGAPVDIKPGAVIQVTLRARARTTITGRVADFVTGTPVAGMSCRATVSIVGTDGPVIGSNIVQSSNTDASGAFAVDAPIGRDRVECNAPSQPTWSEAGGDFDVGATGAHVEVRAVKQTSSVSDVSFETLPWTLPVTVAVVSDKSPVAIGDQILAVDGVSVANVLPGAVMMLLTNHSPGSTIVLQVVRAGSPLTLRITAR